MKSSNAWIPLCGTSATDNSEFSAAPLLDAFERYGGSFFDLDRGFRFSADQLKRSRNHICDSLRKHGVLPSDRILAAVPNGVLFGSVWAASLELGACPILVHADTPEPELHRMAERWNARFIVSAGPFVGEEWNVLNTPLFEELFWQEVASSSRKDAPALNSVPLHPTSGTSGDQKLAIRPGPCAVAEPQHYIETLSLDSSDTILCVTPMSHAYAYGMCFMVALLTSADLFYVRRFDPAAVWTALSEHKVSVFPAVPFILDALLATQKSAPIELPRILLSAGAPLTRQTFEAVRDRLGAVVRPLYGTTETGAISIAPADADFGNSVGPPMKGVEINLEPLQNTDDSAGLGILRVRSASMMAGYADDTGKHSTSLQNGWFETGDLAFIDRDGCIHLQGRVSEVMNVFGLKVSPREVEEIIALLPEVREVKVFANRDMGPETIEAAVVWEGDPDEERIRRHCEDHLVSYKCPTAFRFLDRLPRTPSGKIAVHELSRTRNQI